MITKPTDILMEKVAHAQLNAFYVAIPTLPERVKAIQDTLRDKKNLRNDDVDRWGLKGARTTTNGRGRAVALANQAGEQRRHRG